MTKNSNVEEGNAHNRFIQSFHDTFLEEINYQYIFKMGKIYTIFAVVVVLIFAARSF